MKKILILVQNHQIGGLETNLRVTLNFLKKRGYELFLVTSKGARLEEIEHLLENKLLIDSEALLKNDIKAVNLIRDFIKMNQISSAVLHPFNTYQLGAVACLLEGIPYFIVVHGPINIDVNDVKSYLFNKYFTFPNAQKVFVVSEELSDVLLKDYAIKSEIMYNPINFEKSLGMNSVPKDFVYISRLDEDKLNGLKEVIQFVDLYNQKGNAKKLIIVGDGNKKDELINWINQNFAENSWLELVGYKSNTQDYIDKAQVVFGMGRVVLEALSLGSNIVLTGYDGLKGLVKLNNINQFMYANFSGRHLNNINFETLYTEIKEVENQSADENLQKFIEQTFSVNLIEKTLIKEIEQQHDIVDRSMFSDVLIIDELIKYFKYFWSSEENTALLKYYLQNLNSETSPITKDNMLLKQLLAEISDRYKELSIKVTKAELDNAWYREEFDKNVAQLANYKEMYQEKEKFIYEFKETLENNTAILKSLADTVIEKDKVISNLAEEKKVLIEQIAYYNHVNYDLTHQLTSFQNTKAGRLLNKYYNFRRKTSNLGVNFKKFSYIVKTKGLKEATARSVTYLNSPKKEIVQNNSSQLIELYSKIKSDFAAGSIKGLIIIPSAFEFDELYNQRTINLAKYLAAEGFAVIYVAWQWGKDDQLEKNYQNFLEKIYQVPLFDFLETDFSLVNDIEDKKFIITFPAKEFYDLIKKFRGNAFDIIYDIMDEWEEFYNTGESPWYKKEIEEAIILNSDAVFGVSEPLKEKFNSLRNDIVIIGNGYNENVSKMKNIALKVAATDQKIHLGYFGHMTTSWFDWDLIFKMAENPKVVVHLIGYGADDKTLETMKKYSNIKYYGKVHPGELYKYVEGWHIGLIPFKKSKLSMAVDPIKIYEYLYFGLPTISTGIPHLDNYPLVKHCEDSASVIKSIEEIYEQILNATFETTKLEEFLKNSTWDNRFKAMLHEVDEAKLYQSLFQGDLK